MAKKVIEIDSDKLEKLAEKVAEKLSEKEFEIRSAHLKDMSCNYTYEVLTGKTRGDVMTRKGAQIIHEDLDKAFSEMDVFLAHIDGAFSSWSNNQTPIQDLEAEGELSNYGVSGFKISGVDENKSVILSGYKETGYGIITFETPKIKLSSSYLYVEELRDRLKVVLDEVEAYMNGKTAPQYETAAIEFPENENDEEFENAKVD